MYDHCFRLLLFIMDGDDDVPSLFGINGMFDKDTRYTSYRSKERENTPSLEISKRLDNILSLDDDTQPLSFNDDEDMSFLKIDQLDRMTNDFGDMDDENRSVASRTRSKVSILSEKAITPSKKRVNAPFNSMTFNAAVTKSPSLLSTASKSPFSFSSSRSTITGLSKSASMITPRAPSVFSQSPSTLSFRSGATSNLRSPYTKNHASTLNNSNLSNLSASFIAPSETSSVIEKKRKRKLNIWIAFSVVSIILLGLFLFSYYQVLQLQAQISAMTNKNEYVTEETEADNFGYIPADHNINRSPPISGHFIEDDDI